MSIHTHDTHERPIPKRRFRRQWDRKAAEGRSYAGLVKTRGPRLTVDAHRGRVVRCSCRWIGTVSSLLQVADPVEGLALGPGFPVCPNCYGREGRLRAAPREAK